MIKQIFDMMTPRCRGLLALAVAFFVLYALAGTATMLLVLDLTAKIIEGRPVALTRYWAMLGGLIVFKAVCNAVADLAKHFAGFDIVEQIRKKMILRLKRFSLGFYTEERLGEISTVIHKDVDNMEHVVGHMWSRMASDFIVAFILATGLFAVDWRLGCAMISLVPAALCILAYGVTAGRFRQKRSQDDLADMVSLFVEYIRGIPLLKAFSRSRAFENRLKASTRRFGRSSERTARFTAVYLGGYTLFLGLCFGVLATAGAYLIFQNDLSVVNYLMFIIVSREFYKPFTGMEMHWLNYLKVTDSYQRILKVLDAPVIALPEKPEKPADFGITFENVCFFYERNGFELKNAAFHVEQGHLAALVGPSGSGKTTIINLLLRFWDPRQGIIRIGGTDIRNMDYDRLLSRISIVMQQVILFADTIHNNISIGKKNATREEVVTAAQNAMIHDFITTLPQGYDTPVGENGVGLSGGQKQRISIARAFLKDAPIVILDEMTSHVDPVNEVKIQRAVSNLANNRTVLMIAHRLSTIQNADRILVFDNGRIVQQGTHGTLLSGNGLYRALWTSAHQ